MGGYIDFVYHPILIDLLSSHPTKEVMSAGILESCMINYPSGNMICVPHYMELVFLEYFEHRDLFASEKIDLVLCDFFRLVVLMQQSCQSNP